MQAQLDIENARTEIERVMMELSPDMTPQGHKDYLAGVIDTMHRYNVIDSSTRDELYPEYAG